jgi:hypothetical protein
MTNRYPLALIGLFQVRDTPDWLGGLVGQLKNAPMGAHFAAHFQHCGKFKIYAFLSLQQQGCRALPIFDTGEYIHIVVLWDSLITAMLL